MDPSAIEASIDLVKLLGRDQARTLLEVLGLPRNQRDGGNALAEMLTDVEEGLTGKTRERLIVGLHASLD